MLLYLVDLMMLVHTNQYQSQFQHVLKKVKSDISSTYTVPEENILFETETLTEF